MSCEILIGGDISAALVFDLFTECRQAALELEPGAPGSLGRYPREFRRRLKGSGPLRLVSELPAEALGRLESFCRESGLTYRRHTSAGEGYDGEVAWWRPGMEQPAETTATEDGAAVICVETLTECLEAGSAHEQVARIRALIARRRPPDVPPLIVL